MAEWWEAAPVVEQGGSKGGDDWWQAAPVVDGAATKTAPAQEEGKWERGLILPVEINESLPGREGLRWAWPQLAVDAWNAILAPGDALQGKFNEVNVNTETGAVEPFNREMMTQATNLAAITPAGGAIPKSAGSVAPQLSGQPKRLVTTALRDAGIPMSEVPRRMDELGPDAVLADLSPQLQRQAQALATMPGPGQDKVVSALTARQEGRNSRIMAGVDETLGPSPVPSQIVAGNRANMDALRPEYEAALANATRVDTSDIALTLDSMAVNLRGEAQKAAQRVRQMLNVTNVPDELDPNPRTLFEVRQAIDGIMATETNPKATGLLTDVRRQIDDTLAGAAPGIKDVDAKYAELARQNEAVGTGQQLLDSGRTATRPSELVEMMVGGAVPDAGTGPSAVPFRLSQGVRAEIDRLVGTTVNDLNALKRAVGGDGNWNRDRLVSAFGAEKTDKLLAILEREVRFAATEGPALAGSRTQMLKAAQDSINGKELPPGIVQNALNLKAGDALAGLANNSLGLGLRAHRRTSQAALADALMSRPGSTMVNSLAARTSGSGNALTNLTARTSVVGREEYQPPVRSLMRVLAASR